MADKPKKPQPKTIWGTPAVDTKNSAFNDFVKGISSYFGDVAQRSQQPQQRPSRFGTAPHVVGSAGVPTTKAPKIVHEDESSRRQSTDQRGRGQAARDLAQQLVGQLPETPAKSLADYMAQARAMGLGGGDGTNYDALINQIKANGQSGDAKLAAMYQQLADKNASDSSVIKANFDTSGSSITAASDAASKDTAQAYNQTRQAQTQQLNDLGIGDAAAVLAANGGQAARDQNVALSNIATNKAADVNQNTAHAANAQQYNTGVVESNRSQGVEARSGLQQQLAAKLAELESAKASASSGSQDAVFNAALKLQGMDPDNPSNIAAAQQDSVAKDLANQYKASQIALNQAKASGSAQTVQDALASSVSAQNKLHKVFLQSGGNDNVADFTAWLKAVQLSGSIAG